MQMHTPHLFAGAAGRIPIVLHHLVRRILHFVFPSWHRHYPANLPLFATALSNAPAHGCGARQHPNGYHHQRGAAQ